MIKLGLEEITQLVGGVGALDVLSLTDLRALVGASLGGQHVLGLGVEGVNLALVLLEESGNTGLIDRQRFLGLSGNVADQQFSAVSDINGGDGVEKGVQFHDGLFGGTTSTATAKFGQKEAFGG